MLAPYLRIADTTAMLNPYRNDTSRTNEGSLSAENITANARVKLRSNTLNSKGIVFARDGLGSTGINLSYSSSSTDDTIKIQNQMWNTNPINSFPVTSSRTFIFRNSEIGSSNEDYYSAINIENFHPSGASPRLQLVSRATALSGDPERLYSLSLDRSDNSKFKIKTSSSVTGTGLWGDNLLSIDPITKKTQVNNLLVRPDSISPVIALSVTNKDSTELFTVDTSGAIAVRSSVGTTGQVLTSQGAGASPTWTTISAADGNGIYSGSGTIPSSTTSFLTDSWLINYDSTDYALGIDNDISLGGVFFRSPNLQSEIYVLNTHVGVYNPLRLYRGEDYVGLQSSADLDSSYLLTLPPKLPTEGQSLVASTTPLNLQWVTVTEVVRDTVLKTSTHTALKFEIALIDVSSGPATITPPSDPVLGDWFAVSDAIAKSSSDNITIDFSGSSQNLYGSPQDYIINADGGYVKFIYAGSVTGWIATKG